MFELEKKQGFEVVIERSQAEKEVNDWLDRKKILPIKREQFKHQVDTLIDATAHGLLIWNEDGTCRQKLNFPIGKDGQIEHIDFVFRINVAEMKKNTHDIKADDSDGRLNAIIATLTKLNRTITDKLDSSDASIAQSYAVFFL